MANRGAVVITGASTGIGYSTAKLLVERGFKVFGTVRKQTDADRARHELGEAFTPLLLDVTEADAVARAADQVAASLNGNPLTGLVNNAGIAVPGPLLHLSLDQLRWQMEVNLIAPLRFVQAFAPLLGADRSRNTVPGRVIQISSVAGLSALPYTGAYAASKHALEGLSEALRRELMLYGIDVIIVGPGPIVTPIWDKAETEDLSAFAQTDFAPSMRHFKDFFLAEGRKGLPAERVADVIFTALTAAKPRARYAIITRKFRTWTIPRLLPTRLVDRLISKQFGIHP